MGNIANSTGEQNETSNSRELKVSVNLEKEVQEELKQLEYWSLQEIRKIYAPFRKRKGSPLLTRSEFLRFIQLSRVSSFHIFDILNRHASVNAFEILAVLVLLAYTSTLHKIQFLINAFDFSGQKKLKFNEIVLMYKSVVRGLCIVTHQTPPEEQNLDEYARTLLAQADLNNDQNLDTAEIINWVESNQEATKLFFRFEPKEVVREEFHVFSSFHPYTSHEVELIFNRVSRVSVAKNLYETDFETLQTNSVLRSLINENKDFNNSPKKNLRSIERLSQPKFQKKVEVIDYSFNKNIKENAIKSKELAQTQKNKEKKIRNIIILKGRTLTKKEIFDLREYFDRISHKKTEMLIEDFVSSFSQERYNHMKSVAASLYNFLDQDQNGKVTFKELVLKLYPNLLVEHLPLIERWSRQYDSSFNVHNKEYINEQEDVKKRVLPATCLPRFREMFDFFDHDKKGFLVIEDLQKVLSDVCSQKEIDSLFEESDKEKTGKLSVKEFANVILPYDLEIEGLN